MNPSETIKLFNLSNRKFYKFLGETDGGDFLAYYKERKADTSRSIREVPDA